MAQNTELLNKVVSLLQTRTFVQKLMRNVKSSSSPVQYTYGPAGALLRKNISSMWWQHMVTALPNTYPVEVTKYISEETQPDTGTENPHVHPIEKANTPLSRVLQEQFLAVLDTVGKTLPFSVACIHSDKENSISKEGSPNFLFDCPRETALNLYNFNNIKTAQETAHWTSVRLKWWRQFAGNPSDFTASDPIANQNGGSQAYIQYPFPWGKDNIEVICSHGSQPFNNLQTEQYQCFDSRKKPTSCYVTECSASLERGMLAFIMDAFTVTKKQKSSDSMNLNLHPSLTPYKASVTTLKSYRQQEVMEVVSRVCNDLQHCGIDTLCVDNKLSVQEQEQRNDELGILFTVYITVTCLENGVIQVRNRDTKIKEQMHITELLPFIQRHLQLKNII